jgi:SNF2 family DNA or RNA helicase
MVKRTSQRLPENIKKRLTVTPSPKPHSTDDDGDDEPLSRLRSNDTKPRAKRKKSAAVLVPKTKSDGMSKEDSDIETASSTRVSRRIESHDAARSTTGSRKNIVAILHHDADAFQLEAAIMSKRNKNYDPEKMKDGDGSHVEKDEMLCAPCGTNEASAGNQDDSHDGADTDDIAVDDFNDDDNDDRPFTVEYATSSRSTCRRCDAVIAKDTLRISHVPLFRGKPGYRVYRHLPCAVFSEDIAQVQDVGGWKKLRPDDLEQLRQRILDSQLEVERENEDLDPDELVQKGFQGETRTTPFGFVGTQLPFQIEGQSWMYHQEVHVPEIRGGILADEMGMVRYIVAL